MQYFFVEIFLKRFPPDHTSPVQIAAVGNGNPLSLEPFQAARRKLFYGKAMLVLRSFEGQPGAVRVIARTDGLRDDRAQLRVE